MSVERLAKLRQIFLSLDTAGPPSSLPQDPFVRAELSAIFPISERSIPRLPAKARAPSFVHVGDRSDQRGSLMQSNATKSTAGAAVDTDEVAIAAVLSKSPYSPSAVGKPAVRKAYQKVFDTITLH
jgi:hypothetical protein